MKLTLFINVASMLLLNIAHAAPLTHPLAVMLTNASVETKCAEEDNVYIKLQSPDVNSFSFDATQPIYAKKVRLNRTAPDFSNCNFGSKIDAQKPKAELRPTPFKPASQVLYEDADIIINGIRYPDFWRKTPVPLTIAGKVQENWHLLQVFTKRFKLRGEAFEYLVLYPQDGYWRSRMMPIKGRGENVYGASFLVGPVDEKERPFVEISSISIDPKARMFNLTFAKGGTGQLVFGEPTPTHFNVEVRLQRYKSTLNQPFAALRSMYVAADNADSARLMYRRSEDAPWQGGLIPTVKQSQAVEVKIDRVVPSKHNTLSPDFTFRNFAP